MSLPIPDFSSGQLLVLGDVMLDRYWGGSTSRISPEAPVPVVKVNHHDDRLGGAGNVAKNLSALGCKASLGGIIGNDDAGNSIRQLISTYSINNQLQQSDKLPTITKLRVISRQQQLLRLDFEEQATPFTTALQVSDFEQAIKQSNVVIFSDYAKGSLDNIRDFIAKAKHHNTTVLIDPKGDDFEKYRGADILTPNLAEFEAICGPSENDETLISKALQLIKQFDFGALLITLSERGMLLVEKDAKPLLIPADAKEVYDVTGAGDTVIATMGAAIASGSTYRDAMKLANQAAAIVVGKMGTTSITIQELATAIAQSHVDLNAGVLEKNVLLQQIKQAKSRGEKIVMTNGCFDLLHPGHISYLEKAAELGDRLLIAVNDDDSVKRLKGSERPINTLHDRMNMLAALKSVDWVVSFSEDTPEAIIKQILPDVLIKGGDYKAEELAGFTTVKEHGGDVIVTSFEEGYSSTAIINKIKALN